MRSGFSLLEMLLVIAIIGILTMFAVPRITAAADAAAVRNETNRNGGGYVALLGVRRAWRGLGLGKALLYRSFAEFWTRGVTRVTLGVDAESPTGATKLYERVGMEVESCMVVFEKALA